MSQIRQFGDLSNLLKLLWFFQAKNPAWQIVADQGAAPGRILPKSIRECRSDLLRSGRKSTAMRRQHFANRFVGVWQQLAGPQRSRRITTNRIACIFNC
jgi:hypothetical protein